MSKVEKVFVRSIESILTKKDAMYEELFLGDNGEMDIPLVYQYSQKSVNPRNVDIDPNDIIGKVVALYHDEQNIYCDVLINDVSAKASHFDNVIDNFTVKVDKDGKRNKSYEFIQFIIYDKDFKRKVDEKCLVMKETQKEPQTTLEQVRQNHYNRK